MLHGPRQVRLQEARLQVRQVKGADALRLFGEKRPDLVLLDVMMPNTDGSETSLTARELRLLLLFAARPGEVISRDELLNMCWGIEYLGTTRTLDQHIFVLRKKLGQDGTRLVSARSLGYRFQP